MFLLLFLSAAVSAQYTKEFKRIFFDAEYLYETGFYEEAFNRYKNLLTLDPGNSNILFHCGACCLNIPGLQEEAILYLKEASNGVTYKYKANSHKESGAPVVTYFYLGRAYHLNNQFDDAVLNYEKYMEMGTDEDPMQLKYAELQIAASERARTMVGNPPSFEFYDVFDRFNEDLPSSNNPVVSGDGNTMIFLVDYPSDRKIVMSVKSDGVWSRPRVINSELGMVGETYPVSMSYDGKELYIVHHYYSHADILVSRLEGGRWTEAEALRSPVNGRTSETHASISRDGKTLYFTSDRRGGQGSFDIYVSRLDRDGEWGIPENLGPVINTPYEEHTPFISANDSILFFSSQGHATIGGIDVFFSEKQPDGSWGEPVNAGYPVSTTGEDIFFNPGWDELDGYYAVRRPSDPTTNVINMVIELEPEEQVAYEEAEEPETDLPAGDPASRPEEPVVQSPEEGPGDLVEAIEPPVTDEIEEIMNRGQVQADEQAEEVAEEAGGEVSEMPDREMTGWSLPEIGPCTIYTGIPFDLNDRSLGTAALVEIEKIMDVLEVHPDIGILVTGHTDNTGQEEYNMLLSLQRADRVARILIDRGADPDRIEIRGLGENAPVARNRNPDGTDSPLGRYLNRQVIVTLTGLPSREAGVAEFYVPTSLLPEGGLQEQEFTASCRLTIQVMATHSPVKKTRFRGLDRIQEYVCADGYYRYTHGEFGSYQAARKKLGELHQSGYPDAFIQTLTWYGDSGTASR